MTEPPDASKSTTRQILIFEPDEERLAKELAGRDISPELGRFLKMLVKDRKWPRKINIPSSHDNLAAGLVFTTEFKAGGLEIISELHVFFNGSTMVEKWPVVSESDRISSMPKETFTSIGIEKVRLENDQVVQVSLQMPMPGGASKLVVRTFDFGGSEPRMRFVPNVMLAE